MDKLTKAAVNLYQHILTNHWNGHAIAGPDPIGKINWRVTRFIRSYFPWLPSEERYVYLQGQAYWIKDNLTLYHLTKEDRYLEIARLCADHIVDRQPSDGAWRHPPIRGRRGYISTVEGVWASLGLVALHKQIGDPSYLTSALKWYDYQVDTIGFQQVSGGLAANYYAHSRSRVPNVTTMLLWLMAELFQSTDDARYLQHVDKMLQFIEVSRLESGELPYAYRVRPHFQCYQYNAFQFLDLANFYQTTECAGAQQILQDLAAYLSTGLTERGSARYNCFKEWPEVNYWTAAVAAALRKAHELDLGDYSSLSERAYRYLLGRQRNDGGFDFSERSYRLLRDRRSYPRYQAMILCHLLYRIEGEEKSIVSGLSTASS